LAKSGPFADTITTRVTSIHMMATRTSMGTITHMPTIARMATTTRMGSRMNMREKAMHCRGATPTDRNRRNWPDPVVGCAGCRRSLPLRPCSGAILVLVFALAQGLFWAGIASTFVMGLGTAITVAAIATLAVAAKAVAKRFAAARVGYGTLVLRGVEVGAALVVTAFGVLLLTGFMASERMGMF
jgi:hypothetical protein